MLFVVLGTLATTGAALYAAWSDHRARSARITLIAFALLGAFVTIAQSISDRAEAQFSSNVLRVLVQNTTPPEAILDKIDAAKEDAAARASLKITDSQPSEDVTLYVDKSSTGSLPTEVIALTQADMSHLSMIDLDEARSDHSVLTCSISSEFFSSSCGGVLGGSLRWIGIGDQGPMSDATSGEADYFLSTHLLLIAKYVAKRCGTEVKSLTCPSNGRAARITDQPNGTALRLTADDLQSGSGDAQAKVFARAYSALRKQISAAARCASDPAS